MLRVVGLNELLGVPLEGKALTDALCQFDLE